MTMQWRAEASCLEADPELFAERNSHTSADWRRLEETAALFCETCPVIAACREEGNQHRHPGLWGGIYKHRKQSRIRTRVLVYVRDPHMAARAAS
jgi:WhiB family redox-sensing transcriptional regulator